MPSTRGGADAEVLTSPVVSKTPKGHYGVAALHGRLTEQRSKAVQAEGGHANWLNADSSRSKQDACSEFELTVHTVTYGLWDTGEAAGRLERRVWDAGVCVRVSSHGTRERASIFATKPLNRMFMVRV